MKDKWLKFHTAHSPVEVKVDPNPHNTLRDWQRLDWDNTFIDGISLGKIVQNKFSITSETRGSFSEDMFEKLCHDVLLKNVPTDKKEAAYQYIVDNFHQGGYLQAASGGFPVAANLVAVSGDHGDKKVNIKTTKDGFTFQEIYTPHSMLPTMASHPDLQKKYGIKDEDGDFLGLFNPMIPDEGNEFFAQAQVTLDVSFSGKKIDTTITSNTINYGNEEFKSYIDQRGILQRFVDFIKGLIGINAVKDLTPNTPVIRAKPQEKPADAPRAEVEPREDEHQRHGMTQG